MLSLYRSYALVKNTVESVNNLSRSLYTWPISAPKVSVDKIAHLEALYTMVENLPRTNKKKRAYSFQSIRGNKCALFCNQLDQVLDQLPKLGYTVEQVTEAIVVGNTNTVYRKNPKHKYRIFFNPVSAGVDRYLEVKTLVDRYPTGIFPSLTLKRLLYSAQRVTDDPLYHTREAYRLKWFYGNLFMDVDDDQMYLLLTLTLGDIVKKCSPIETKTF